MSSRVTEDFVDHPVVPHHHQVVLLKEQITRLESRLAAAEKVIDDISRVPMCDEHTFCECGSCHDICKIIDAHRAAKETA